MTALVWMSRSQYTLGAQKGALRTVEEKEGGMPGMQAALMMDAHQQGLTQWVGGELPAVYLQGMSPTSSVLGFLGYWES